MSSGNFEDENEEDFKPKRSLKIGNVQPPGLSKKEKTLDFNKKVDSIESSKKDSQKNINNLSLKLSQIMQDKTLASNRNPLIKENERLVLIELINFCKQLDLDENEEINAGTSSLTTLILTLLLTQRDRINQVEFELNQLKQAKK